MYRLKEEDDVVADGKKNLLARRTQRKRRSNVSHPWRTVPLQANNKGACRVTPIKVGAMNNKIKMTPKITLSEDLANLGTLMTSGLSPGLWMWVRS